MKPSVLAFGASTSSTSINAKLAKYAAHQLDADVTFLDLNDFEMPLFSIDKESANGIPEPAHRFKQHIRAADGILVSLAEHNGSYTAAYKNLVDWTSRIAKELWEHKPMLLLATSPGKRGAQSVLNSAASDYPHRAANVINTYSLPSFKHNFDNGITDADKARELQEKLQAFESVLTSTSNA